MTMGTTRDIEWQEAKAKAAYDARRAAEKLAGAPVGPTARRAIQIIEEQERAA